MALNSIRVIRWQKRQIIFDSLSIYFVIVKNEPLQKNSLCSHDNNNGDKRMEHDNPSPAVTSHRYGRVWVITVNNPPVNALSAAVRLGLFAAIEQGEVQPDVGAVLIVSEGKTFIAGADIREFGKPPCHHRCPTCATASRRVPSR